MTLFASINVSQPLQIADHNCNVDDVGDMKSARREVHGGFFIVEAGLPFTVQGTSKYPTQRNHKISCNGRVGRHADYLGL